MRDELVAMFRDDLPFWHNFFKQVDKLENLLNTKNFDAKSRKLFDFNFILKTLRTYKLHPNGNGIKWSKEEKEDFIKLSYKEQRKMIVRKSELKSALFPYVTVDYEPYKYSERISDSAKRAYQKAQSLLNQNKNLDFSSLNSNIKEEIFNNLRLAYKERYLKAGVELAKLLFKNSFLGNHKNAESEILECVLITKKLLGERIPENAYMYYKLYQWSSDEYRLFLDEFTPDTLKINKEQARECYNLALESIIWEAIDEEAYRFKNSIVSAELWLAAAIKYQSPLAFGTAASHYLASNMPNLYGRSSILYSLACNRCAIALGSDNKLYGLAQDSYGLESKKLWSYYEKTPEQRGLINGLDPYFDEKFPPKHIIDLSAMVTGYVYNGFTNRGGLENAIKNGIVKDIINQEATIKDIKHFYLRMWKIIVYTDNQLTMDDYNLGRLGYLAYILYENLPYGYPSARPYIFPKEVLDLEIDFTKGVEDLKEA